MTIQQTTVDPDMVAAAEERRQALEQRWSPWRSRTTAQLLDVVADRHPDRPYVLTDARSHTYRGLQELSERLAAGLHAVGVGAGDHVAVDMANYPEAVALKFAVARLGAVSVSINFLLRHEELGYVLRQSRAKVLVTMDAFRGCDYLDCLDRLAPGWETAGGGTALPHLERVFVFPTGESAVRGSSLDDLLALGDQVDREQLRALSDAVDPQSPSDLLYTSGTTGFPKGALLTHDAVVRTAYSCAYTRAFRDGHRICFALPIYHVFGYVEASISVLFAGGAINPHTSFDAAATLRSVAAHEIGELMCVPAMTVVVLEEARKGSYDLAPLHTMFSSGAAHAPHLWQDMLAVLGVEQIFSAYGQTETTASTACMQPGDPVARLTTTNGRIKPAGIAGDPSLGGALAVYKAVHSETGEDLPPGQVGELVASGPIITRGYYDKPQETADLFDEQGWMRTGDLGYLDEDGYLTLTGRKKESYRCGGELVMPTEVEAVLVDHPGVRAAHIVGVPHERMGEVGCAFVVPVPGALPDPEELIAHCAQRLARFKVPAVVVLTEAAEIPVTVTGRVRKFELVDRATEALRARTGARQAVAAP